MSIRRLVPTAAAMAGVALLLGWLAPDLQETVAALTHPQRTADTQGPEVLLLAVAGAAAWLVWTWGALGLLLTAASVAPGVAGAAARSLLAALLPAGARRSAALALGIGLVVAAPMPAGSPVGGDRPELATAGAPTTVPDWPTDTGVPDWPPEKPGAHVVVPGDCLWDIAATRLSADGSPPPSATIATAVQAWWSANAEVIGADPDLLFPGQVLQSPDQP